MLKFRTPLLAFHLIASTLFVAGLLGWIEVFRPGPYDTESWRLGPSTIPLVASALLATGFLAALTTGLMELSLVRGWEPRWLERMWIGVTVTGKGHSGNEKWVQIRTNRDLFEFVANEEEFESVKVGDIVHLWTIGKYLSRSIKVDESVIRIDPSPIETIKEHPVGASFFFLVYLGVVGFFCWFGIYGHIASDVAYLSTSRRGPSVHVVLDGEDLRIRAFICNALMIAGWVYLYVVLRKGTTFSREDD